MSTKTLEIWLISESLLVMVVKQPPQLIFWMFNVVLILDVNLSNLSVNYGIKNDNNQFEILFKFLVISKVFKASIVVLYPESKICFRFFLSKVPYLSKPFEQTSSSLFLNFT